MLHPRIVPVDRGHAFSRGLVLGFLNALLVDCRGDFLVNVALPTESGMTSPVERLNAVFESNLSGSFTDVLGLTARGADTRDNLRNRCHLE